MKPIGKQVRGQPHVVAQPGMPFNIGPATDFKDTAPARCGGMLWQVWKDGLLVGGGPRRWEASKLAESCGGTLVRNPRATER